MPVSNVKNTICLAAILKEEENFLDEWLLYHRLIGIDHFFLYDDDPKLPLETFLSPHKDYVTVIPWFERHAHIPGRNRQTKAYTHASENFAKGFQWITFIDADEFIVLRKHENIKDFLSEFENYSAVSLNWHVFGHNGYYDNPKGLITSSLTRRMLRPNCNVKTFTKSDAINEISSAHFCRLKYGFRVDANKKILTNELYHDKTAIANINHNQCRSFLNWMNRVKRGDVALEDIQVSSKREWRVDEEACLKQFVKTVALDKNEYIDEYMLKYKDILKEQIKRIERVNKH